MKLVRCAGNPVLATSVAGLATSATAFATMEVAAPVARYAAWAIVLECVSMFRGRVHGDTHSVLPSEFALWLSAAHAAVAAPHQHRRAFW